MSFLRLRLLSLLSAVLLLAPLAAQASTSVFISARVAPPALPVYEQPYCPGPGYVWTPGYWAWNGDDYYWVRGTWIIAPIGMLWTPGYWGWANNVYVWYPGYWGPRVGYYGGINYGHGYTGNGYAGGYWRDHRFYYNRAVNRVDVTRVHNTYERHVVVNNVTVNRVSYNGGNGGTRARPTHDEENYARQHHPGPTDAQRRHEQDARVGHGAADAGHRDRPSRPDHPSSDGRAVPSGPGHRDAGRNETQRPGRDEPAGQPTPHRAPSQHRQNDGKDHRAQQQRDIQRQQADRRARDLQAGQTPPQRPQKPQDRDARHGPSAGPEHRGAGERR